MDNHMGVANMRTVQQPYGLLERGDVETETPSAITLHVLDVVMRDDDSMLGLWGGRCVMQEGEDPAFLGSILPLIAPILHSDVWWYSLVLWHDWASVTALLRCTIPPTFKGLGRVPRVAGREIGHRVRGKRPKPANCLNRWQRARSMWISRTFDDILEAEIFDWYVERDEMDIRKSILATQKCVKMCSTPSTDCVHSNTEATHQLVADLSAAAMDVHERYADEVLCREMRQAGKMAGHHIRNHRQKATVVGLKNGGQSSACAMHIPHSFPCGAANAHQGVCNPPLPESGTVHV